VSAPGRARAWFVGYALLLFTLTHWPRLRIDVGSIPRPDVALHVGALAAWTLLLQRSAWFGPVGSARNLCLSTLAAAAYAALDEWSQAIPGLGRTPAWDDLAANLLGVGAGAAAGALLLAIEPTPDGA
jgi:hypothetical protein